ncbi:hypothetical protein [Streptomyces sp. NBC_00525]|uniref:hypothetical protein n=1 Tax=Streptomyces sp. NBC_00525 TaxID=2903660 RepID=UPI002E80B6B1|nr:hypothetical protein [Streptomyces sp. NBC_00525]WUC95639.1 hypothetical protein OG710_19465 [Streptomyces sp. NBC_00525]
MKRGFIAACVVAVAVSAAAAGCAGDGSSGPARTAPAAGPERDATRAEELRISDALQALTARCMERHGFRYWPGSLLTLEESRLAGYVNDDTAWAAEHGYGSRIEEKADRARRANPNGTYRAKLSQRRRAAYDEALGGGPDTPVLTAEIPTPKGTGKISKRIGGCSAEAEKKLYGDPAAWFRADKAVSNLQGLYVPRITRDPEFTAALKDWARCMDRAGYPYADPPAAREAVARQAVKLPEGEAFAAEKRVAVAEARCARSSALATVAREREAYYRDRLPARYRELIDTHRRLERRAYARAERITGPRA